MAAAGFTGLLTNAIRGKAVPAVGNAARAVGLDQNVKEVEYWIDAGHDWKLAHGAASRVDAVCVGLHKELQARLTGIPGVLTEADAAAVTQEVLAPLIDRNGVALDLHRKSPSLPRFGADAGAFQRALMPAGVPLVVPFQCACTPSVLTGQPFYDALTVLARKDVSDGIPLQVCDVQHVPLHGPSRLSVGGAHRVDAGNQPRRLSDREIPVLIPMAKHTVVLPTGTAEWDFTPGDVTFRFTTSGTTYAIRFGDLADTGFVGLPRLASALLAYKNSAVLKRSDILSGRGERSPYDDVLVDFLLELDARPVKPSVETVQRIFEALKFCGDDTLTELARVSKATLFTTGDSLAWIMAIKKGIPCCVLIAQGRAHVWYSNQGTAAEIADALATIRAQRAAAATARRTAYEQMCRTIQGMLHDAAALFAANRASWAMMMATPRGTNLPNPTIAKLRDWASYIMEARTILQRLGPDARYRLLQGAASLAVVQPATSVNAITSGGGAAAAGGSLAAGGGPDVALAAGGGPTAQSLVSILADLGYQPLTSVMLQEHVPNLNAALNILMRGPQTGTARSAAGQFTRGLEAGYALRPDEQQSLIYVLMTLIRLSGAGDKPSQQLLESVNAVVLSGSDVEEGETDEAAMEEAVARVEAARDTMGAAAAAGDTAVIRAIERLRREVDTPPASGEHTRAYLEEKRAVATALKHISEGVVDRPRADALEAYITALIRDLPRARGRQDDRTRSARNSSRSRSRSAAPRGRGGPPDPRGGGGYGGGGAGGYGGNAVRGGRGRRGGGVDERSALSERITDFLSDLLRYNIYLHSRTAEDVAKIINLVDVVEDLETVTARLAAEGITLSVDEDNSLLRYPGGTIRRDLYISLILSAFGDDDEVDAVEWPTIQFMLDYFLRAHYYTEDDAVVRIVKSLDEQTLALYENRLADLIDAAKAGGEAPTGDLMEILTGPVSASATLAAPATVIEEKPVITLPPPPTDAELAQMMAKLAAMQVDTRRPFFSGEEVQGPQRAIAASAAGGARKIRKTRKRRGRSRKTRRR